MEYKTPIQPRRMAFLKYVDENGNEQYFDMRGRKPIRITSFEINEDKTNVYLNVKDQETNNMKTRDKNDLNQ